MSLLETEGQGKRVKVAADAKTSLLAEKIYGEGEEGRKEWLFAQEQMEQVDRDLELREEASDVFNGISYSRAYEFNRRKAINYSPPKNLKDDRQVSFGLVHEKVVTFCAIFLKYVWKRRVKAYDPMGRIIRELGEVFDLGVEHSYRLERFSRKILLILWEVFTQGDAWVMEDWQVRLVPNRRAYFTDEGGKEVEVTDENMDYTFEFMEKLRYRDDPEKPEHQERRAESVVLDGRQVILANPEVEEVQDQERATIEFSFPKPMAEQLFGSLDRFKHVPEDRPALEALVGSTTTLFSADRLKEPKQTMVAHFVYEKMRNRFNLFLNGVMMLPRATTMQLFHPRRNYPLTGVHGERLKGSAYSRSIPAKTKFNADFMDWALKMLSEAFEQGITPAILSRGKYTLSRKMFKAGQVTHGVKKEDYEFASPERAGKGITSSEFSFANMLKEMFEAQTASGTASGEVNAEATATAIATADAASADKLGFLLDGLTLGFIDLAERRIETIESKYTMKRRKTLVDKQEVDVYQNFTVNAYGYENTVMMDDRVGTDAFEPEKQKAQDMLFKASFDDREKRGLKSKYFLANPDFIRGREYTTCVEVMPEQRKNTQLQMISFWDEVRNVKELIPGSRDEKWQEEYLEVSGRPDDLFGSADMLKLQEMKAQAEGATPGAHAAPAGGSKYSGFNKPTVKPSPQAMQARRA